MADSRNIFENAHGPSRADGPVNRPDVVRTGSPDRGSAFDRPNVQRTHAVAQGPRMSSGEFHAGGNAGHVERPHTGPMTKDGSFHTKTNATEYRAEMDRLSGNSVKPSKNSGPVGVGNGAPSEPVGTPRKNWVQSAAPTVQRMGRGAGKTFSSAGPVAYIFGACLFIMFMAKKNGATVNMERALVGGFFVTLVLMAIGQKAPGLAVAFAGLILVEILLSYGTTAFKNFSPGSTNNSKVPQIASTGATAGAAATGLAAWFAAKNAGSLISSLGNLFGSNGTTPVNSGESESKSKTSEPETGEESELQGAESSEGSTLDTILGDGAQALGDV